MSVEKMSLGCGCEATIDQWGGVKVIPSPLCILHNEEAP